MTEFIQRNRWCNDLQADDNVVQLCGWVNSRRDHGGVIFIDLRDKSGICQLVARPEQAEAFAQADRCRSETVVAISGRVMARPDDMVNDKIDTGTLEVELEQVQILNFAEHLPFSPADSNTPSEEVRLRSRYVDFRRDEIQRVLQMRSRAQQIFRDILTTHDFLELDTPILIRSSREGAREFIVPSRLEEHSFYALAQSPQTFKQLFMAGGLERYFQICHCFRDEDLRADRQPEFLQVDTEMSWVNERDVQEIAEQVLKALVSEVAGATIDTVPVLTYKEAMEKYGSDKPDMRTDLELIPVEDLVAQEKFDVLGKPAREAGHRVVAMRVPGGASYSRSIIDNLTDFVRKRGSGGLAYIKVIQGDNGLDFQAPILKYLQPETVQAVADRCGCQAGDLIVFGAGTDKVVNVSMSDLRVKLLKDFPEDIANGKRFAALWVTEFPLFEPDDKGRLVAVHHPFTQPSSPDWHLDKLSATARAYDLVLNGSEVAGGSIRNHDYQMQMQLFQASDIGEQEAQEIFGFLLDALRSGCPPHGGIAYGFDRLLTELLGLDSLRDVVPFPKTQSGQCLVTKAPGTVRPEQLQHAHISLLKKRSK